MVLIKEKEDLDLVLKIYQVIGPDGSVDHSELLNFLHKEGKELQSRIVRFNKKRPPYQIPPRGPKKKVDQLAVESNVDGIYADQAKSHHEDGDVEVIYAEISDH